MCHLPSEGGSESPADVLCYRGLDSAQRLRRTTAAPRLLEGVPAPPPLSCTETAGRRSGKEERTSRAWERPGRDSWGRSAAGEQSEEAAASG